MNFIFKKVLPVFLTVFVLVSSAPFALAEDYISTPVTYWQNLLHDIIRGTESVGLSSAMQSFLGWMSGSVCESSDDGYHHSDSIKGAKLGSDSHGEYAVTRCKFCGVDFRYYSDDLKKAYDYYVGNDDDETCSGVWAGRRLSDELGTTIIGSDCVIIPISVDSVSGQSDGLFSPGFSFSFRRLTSKQCNFSFHIVIYSAPLSGTYEFCTDVSLDNCEFYRSMYSTSMYPGDLFTYEKSAYIDKTVYLYGYSPQFNISGSFFFKVDPFEYSVNDYTASIGGINSRPTSLTGDYGIMGDNGTITKTDNTYIFDETTNNYYNPLYRLYHQYNRLDISRWRKTPVS